MRLGQRILVIDDSRCMLEVLGQILRSHCSTLLFSSTYRDAPEPTSGTPPPPGS